MPLHELAGKPAPAELLIDVSALTKAYYDGRPDASVPEQRITFGTSGHRGTSLENSFNEQHILAICQAVSEFRQAQGITGPLFLGKDTHALSDAAHQSALEVFAANGVTTVVQANNGVTPTPVISHAILQHNQSGPAELADGVVITPSHNPPRDGGLKYNATHGGPADAGSTTTIQNRANEILEGDLKDVRRIPHEQAIHSETTHERDYVVDYVADLANVVDMDAIASASLKIGVDPLGGSGVGYWEPIADRYGLNLEIVNSEIDPTFSFMRVDKDGKIRMDCSSPYAMAGLVDLKDRFDIAFGNDPDFDRHGIVTPSVGLMNPNHYLAVAISYLLQHRTDWPSTIEIGKTLVSSSMIDRVVGSLGRSVCEVPVGFKWFVDGLSDGSLGFGGEESAGESFLRTNGGTWTTDKDGIILDLLAAEILAKTKKDPGEHYAAFTEQFGDPVYERIDVPATLEQKAALKSLSPESVASTQLAGDEITAKLTHAPGNNAAIGGLKVATEHGWFAARPSGTENIYKIYAESFRGAEHLKAIQAEAQQIVDAAL